MLSPKKPRQQLSRTGLNKLERAQIAEAVDDLVADLASRFSKPQSAIARQILYRVQSSSIFGGNPTSAQKRAAFKRWEGTCQRCNKTVDFEEASFHHVRRDTSNPHQPINLKPYHDHCHDQEEGASSASLRKGSPRGVGRNA